MSPRTQNGEGARRDFGHWSRPGGGPRGLLRIYILHLIEEKPRHGYEIIQDIQAKTEGAWNPGAGAIYPVLKKLVSEGLIEAESPGGVDDRHVYKITSKGLKHMVQLKAMIGNFGQRWTAMRNLFMELVGPENREALLIDTSRKQFEFTREFVKSKLREIEPSELEYLLREYALDLERQLGWTKQTLEGLGPRPAVASKKR